MRKTIQLATTLLAFAAAPVVSAHCQIPCGIYADENVIETMGTDQETIEKAMKQIEELSKEPTKNANQLVRWVTNKEQHAQSIQDTVSAYFLAQRIKLEESGENKEAYLNKLTLLHKITVLAMKCKQTTDLENAQKLHEAIEAFKGAYMDQKTKTTGAHHHGDGTAHKH